jgi:hypothetical protein
MSRTRLESWHFDLQDLLGLAVPPVAIAFSSDAPPRIERLERAMPPATVDGRTGAVAASCVFWIEGTRGVFTTKAEDHGNCSVGSLTHGFKTMQEVAGNADVVALCESGWVTPEGWEASRWCGKSRPAWSMDRCGTCRSSRRLSCCG